MNGTAWSQLDVSICMGRARAAPFAMRELMQWVRHGLSPGKGEDPQRPKKHCVSGRGQDSAESVGSVLALRSYQLVATAV